MGKASSSKKVARAAGIGGGRSRHRQTPWSFFGIITLIVILGVVGTVVSRDRRMAQITGAGNTPPTVGTTWNEGYAVYVCGKFLPAISTKSPDPQGITTRQPGIINIHPTTKAAAGKNATLGKFASAVGMTLNAAELQVPGGTLYQNGNSCQGQPGHVYIKQFAYIGDTVGQLYNGAKNQLPKLDPRSVPLQDQALLTIAFVPANDASKIPAPPASVNTALSKLAASSSTTTTTAPATTQTTPATSSTTAPKASTTTSTTTKK
ncbi:MAG TPA: hypothetical protein VFN68_05040 [Acidimicrobiales bacterium]|nr:hypothetical protein [Acidimicrobiales bacterium]